MPLPPHLKMCCAAPRRRKIAMLVDTIAHWRNYNLGPAWKDAMTWLETAFQTCGRATPIPDATGGSTPPLFLEDGVHAAGQASVTVTSCVTRLRGEARYEVHRRLCDVHLVLSGCERFAYAPGVHLEPDGDFDEAADIGFCRPRHLEMPVETACITLSPGIFVLVLPDEAHIPALAVDERKAPLRKCIAKIPFASLRL